MSIQELYNKIENFDWFYEMSDDYKVWQRGEKVKSIILSEAKCVEGGKALWDAFQAYHYSGPSFGTEKKPKPEKPIGLEDI